MKSQKYFFKMDSYLNFWLHVDFDINFVKFISSSNVIYSWEVMFVDKFGIVIELINILHIIPFRLNRKYWDWLIHEDYNTKSFAYCGIVTLFPTILQMSDVTILYSKGDWEWPCSKPWFSCKSYNKSSSSSNH